MRRRALKWGLLLVVIGAVGVGAAMAASASMHSNGGTVKAVKSKTFGMVLVSSTGLTLYRYTPDTKGKSVCSGACLKFWPPLLVKAGVKPTVGAGANRRLLGTIKAAHGKRQVTYAGFPLYFFAQDKKAGQTNGQGFGGKWYLVNTKGALVKHAVKTSAPAPTTTTTSGGSAWG
jgi:predicted lipoprotein with Yx(FWY)xxD motif